ncbi:MAG: DUF58 domain-containing protein, partial [Verrucomicrobia bacterium]|nr:DUF58 domain-containing protein [Verrucomicrobiota bacterium]
MKSTAAFKFLPPQLAERIKPLSITVRAPMEGALQGLHRSPRFGSSVEFAEYREYTPGDPPNRIDWAVYAKTDRYMVRRFHEETNLRACVLLDTSESLAFKEAGPCSKLEYGCFLAGGLMYILINQGDAVGLMTFTDHLDKTLPPVASLEGLRPLLLELEAARGRGGSDIETALHEAAESFRSRSLVIVISDFLQSPARIARAFHHLRHNGHDVTAFHILDAAEIQFPFHGLVELKELETGRKILINADEIRGRYARQVESYFEEMRRAASACA